MSTGLLRALRVILLDWSGAERRGLNGSQLLRRQPEAMLTVHDHTDPEANAGDEEEVSALDMVGQQPLVGNKGAGPVMWLDRVG